MSMKRRWNLALAFFKAISGSTCTKRARLTAAKSRSPSSSSSLRDSFLRERVADFGHFFAQFFKDAVGILPVESRARGFAGELQSFEHGGQSARNAIEQRGCAFSGVFGTVFCGAAFLLKRYFSRRSSALMRSQFLQYLRGIFGADVAEDVRMAANHFVVNVFDDVGDREAPLFARDFGMKNHLQEQVAHFFGKFRVVAGIERVENFVNFFNQVGPQGGVSLLAVPRTTLWRAQTFLHGHEFFKPLAGASECAARRGFLRRRLE